MALIPGEPAGAIATRTAGAVYVEAVLSGRDGEPVDAGALPVFAGARSFLEDAPVSPGGTMVRGEIRALSEPELRAALDLFVRHVTTTAALAEAVLETCAERRSPATVAPAGAVGALARDLYTAGRRVRFRECWTPLPVGADVGLGAGGPESGLERFFFEHPAWEVLR